MRYFLKLAYNGSRFHGWQSQPNASSVQQTVEEALSTIFRRRVPITGAGRTDTGVHARTMFAHFDLDSDIAGKDRILISLNRLLGKDIAVYDIINVKEDAHARFNATSREYRYFISSRTSPFLYPFCWHCPSEPDYGKMNEAASILKEISDFTSFAKLHSDSLTNICKVSKAEWSAESIAGEEVHVFTIRADRFLRNMVRAVVGTLIDIGRGKTTLSDFKRIIEEKNRCAAGTSMPAHALFLWDVTYPDNIFIS